MRNYVGEHEVSSESRVVQIADHLGHVVHLNGYSSREGRV